MEGIDKNYLTYKCYKADIKLVQFMSKIFYNLNYIY